VGADPEHDPDELEDIEQDKVRTNSSSSPYLCLVGAKQMPDVHNLKNIKHNPVDGNKNVAQREGSHMEVGDTPDGPTGIVSVSRCIVGIHNGCYKGEDERQKGKDLVGDNVPLSIRVTGERV